MVRERLWEFEERRERSEVILLRLGRVVPVKDYSPGRIAEFEASDAELAPFAAELRKAAEGEGR